MFGSAGFRCQRATVVGSDFWQDSDVAVDEPAEAAVIRWFFWLLFVQSILQVVNGQDEIGMLESGIRNRLHIWRMEDD